MTQVRLSRRASAELKAIHAYIALDSLRAADGVVRNIRAALRRLAAFPMSGSTRDNDPDAEGLRFLVVRGYSIAYRLDRAGDVLVVRILGPRQTLGG